MTMRSMARTMVLAILGAMTGSCGRAGPPGGGPATPSAPAVHGTATAAPPTATATALPLSATTTVGALEVRRSSVVPSVEAYRLDHEQLTNLEAMQQAIGRSLTAGELRQLDTEGFVLLPWQPPAYGPDSDHDARFGGRIDDMVDLLGEVGGADDPAFRRPENAVFVSTDVLLHAFHVLVDRAYQQIETTELQPRLRRMTQQLLAAAVAKTRGMAEGPLRASGERVSAYLAVALALLEAAPRQPSDPPPVWSDPDEPDPVVAPAALASDAPEQVRTALLRHRTELAPETLARARAELERVLAASGPAPSPLYEPLSQRPVDYSQFAPRGHYAHSPILRSYFRAMMWFGHVHFALESPELTRDALLLAQLFATTGSGDSAPASAWEAVYEPTTFFVGSSDDATFASYGAVARKSHGADPASWDLTSEARLEAFCRWAMQDLPAPRVRAAAFRAGPDTTPWQRCRPDRRGMRLMGQRFIPDSYFFSKLTGEPGLPSTPTALMVMSVLGSATADALLDEWLTEQAPSAAGSVRQVLRGLQSEVAQLDVRTWGSSLYYGWLYTLRPLLGSVGEGYPMFMRSDGWRRKSLLAALGSWTELRHDTLLYAKQSGTEKGGDEAERHIPPVPKGFVEPNLELLARLDALVRLSRQGLARRGLLDERHQEPFELLADAVAFCTALAEKELACQPITDEQYERLRTLHAQLAWALSPIDAEIITERDARAAVVADVHTDAAAGRILYEATGAPLQILVAVRDGGGARLTRGAAYSYYEFTQPIGSRLTDERWQQRVYGVDGALPDRPRWVQRLMARP